MGTLLAVAIVVAGLFAAASRSSPGGGGLGPRPGCHHHEDGWDALDLDLHPHDDDGHHDD